MNTFAHRISRIAMASLLAFAVCVGVTGCQPQASEDQRQPQEQVIGETNNAYVINVTNDSGKSIVGLAIKHAGEETHGMNLLASDQRISAGATVKLAIPKSKDEADGTYLVDIKVTFNDGSVSDLCHLDVKDFDAMSIQLQGKIGYVTYQSTAAKRVVSTLEYQTELYLLADPDALNRDKAEEEEEKRRLEKLEDDLKKTAEEIAAEEANAKAASQEEEDVQSNDLPDDPIETNEDYSDSGDSED